MSTGTVVETRDLINWELVNAALLPQRRGKPGVTRECVNPWCGRLVDDGHSFCPYCRVHGRNDLGHVYEAFANSKDRRSGRALPADSRGFLAGLAKLAHARDFITEDFAMRFVTGGDFSGELLAGAAEIFAHIHVPVGLSPKEPATATTKRRNSSTGKPVFRSDAEAAIEPIRKARPPREEEAEVVEATPAPEPAEAAAELMAAKIQDDGIRPGELMAVAEKPVEEVKPAAAQTIEPAKPAPIVPTIIPNVEYTRGWPVLWSNSGEPFEVNPEGEYAAICQVCSTHFTVRGAVVHGLRKADAPALCPKHRKCRCGNEAEGVFHSKVPGMEDANGQPVCFRCRGNLIQRQRKLLALAMEPCPHVGQEGCYGKKKPGFPVCAGCHNLGRTAPSMEGLNGRNGTIASASVEKETPTVPATMATAPAAA